MPTKFTSCIFHDIKKTFDTIDHSKFLQKISVYGVRGFALEYFNTYSTNKARCVKLGDCNLTSSYLVYHRVLF